MNAHARHLTGLVLRLLSAWLFVWLITKEFSLHCTQTASFWSAIFEMTPHIEDSSTLVYEGEWVWTIRALLGAILMALAAWPLAGPELAARRLVKWSSVVACWLLLVGIGLAFAFTSRPDVGERFQWMFGVGSLVALGQLGLAALRLRLRQDTGAG